jgi:hypothetical protein
MNPPMNIRAREGDTPQKRIVAVLRTLILEMVHPRPSVPDYADIEERLGPYLEYELVTAQLKEAQNTVAELARIATPEAQELYLRTRRDNLQTAVNLIAARIQGIEFEK